MQDQKALKRLERDEISPRAIMATQFRVQKKELMSEQCKRLAKQADQLARAGK